MIVRTAAADDLPALHRLCEEGLGYPYPEEEMAKKLAAALADPGQRVLVARVQDRVAGFIHGQRYDVLYAPHMVNVLGIAVDNAARRGGVGRALLAALEDWARLDGAAGVRLVSGASRTGAHAFYAACGYEKSKEQFNFKKTL